MYPNNVTPNRFLKIWKDVKATFPNNRFTIAGGCLRDYVLSGYDEDVPINDIDVFIEVEDEFDYEYHIHQSPVNYLRDSTIRDHINLDSYDSLSEIQNKHTYEIIYVADTLSEDRIDPINLVAVRLRNKDGGAEDFGKIVSDAFDINVCQLWTSDNGTEFKMSSAAEEGFVTKTILPLYEEITENTCERMNRICINFLDFSSPAVVRSFNHTDEIIGYSYWELTDVGKSLGLSLRKK